MTGNWKEIKRIDDLYTICFYSENGNAWEAYVKGIPDLLAKASSPITALEMLIPGVLEWERVHGSKENG